MRGGGAVAIEAVDGFNTAGRRSTLNSPRATLTKVERSAGGNVQAVRHQFGDLGRGPPLAVFDLAQQSDGAADALGKLLAGEFQVECAADEAIRQMYPCRPLVLGL